jgi:hypothetical protein
MFDMQGRRLRYAEDDEEETVASMSRKEHLYHVNPDKEYASNVAKQKNFDTDLEILDDLAAPLADKPMNKESRDKWHDKQRQRAIQGRHF